MKQKQFLFKYWATVNKEEKYLTLKITPAQWEDTGCPNGYLFIRGGDFAIYVNKRYEVIEEKSSPDWRDYFEIQLTEGLVLQVYSMKCRVNLNLPEPIDE